MKRSVLDALVRHMVLSGLLCLCVAGCFARPPEPPDREKLRDGLHQPKELRLIVVTNKTKYKSGEPMTVQVMLQNTGQEEITVYNELWPPGWLIELEIQDGDGHRVYRSSPEVFERTLERSHYAVLYPLCFVGIYYTVEPNQELLEAGRYQLRAKYENRHDCCFASMEFTQDDLDRMAKAGLYEKAFVKPWTGDVWSNAVEFRVSGRKWTPPKQEGR